MQSLFCTSNVTFLWICISKAQVIVFYGFTRTITIFSLKILFNDVKLSYNAMEKSIGSFKSHMPGLELKHMQLSSFVKAYMIIVLE